MLFRSWLHFETPIDDPSRYQVVVLGMTMLQFRHDSPVRFLIFYLLCGLVAAAAHVFVEPASPVVQTSAQAEAIARALSMLLVNAIASSVPHAAVASCCLHS